MGDVNKLSISPIFSYMVFSPRESVGVCFYRRWFVCMSVTTITEKIVNGFIPNFMGRSLGRGKPK